MEFSFIILCIFLSAINSNVGERMCRHEGDQFCVDCKKAVKCFYTTSINLHAKVYHCDEEDMTCLDGDCTPKDNYPCDENVANYKFVCGQEGRFPDAYDCLQYHDCRKSLSFRTTRCKEGLSYDASSAQCSRMMTTGGCKEGDLLPICRTLGQSGQALNNRTMYYICSLETTGQFLIPKMYMCPKGFIFMNGRCFAE